MFATFYGGFKGCYLSHIGLRISSTYFTVDPRYFDYYFLDTLDERRQGIPNDWDKKGGRKGYQCDQNYNPIER